MMQILSRVYSGAGLRLAEGRLMTSCEFVAQGECEFFTTLANLLLQAAGEKNRSTIANFSIPVSSR
jgi:hypothetical protein